MALVIHSMMAVNRRNMVETRAFKKCDCKVAGMILLLKIRIKLILLAY